MLSGPLWSAAELTNKKASWPNLVSKYVCLYNTFLDQKSHSVL